MSFIWVIYYLPINDPFVDLASGGNVFKYAENLEQILELLPEDAKVIPGHGELTNITGIETSHTMPVRDFNVGSGKSQCGYVFGRDSERRTIA